MSNTEPDLPLEVSDPINPIASVTSAGSPQPGQDHRSSGNFSMEMKNPPKKVQWLITGNARWRDISFNVRQDRSGESDPTLYKGLRNGSVTEYDGARSLYIAKPANAGGASFGVQVWSYHG